MKIEHLTIYGFGKWKDYSLDLSDHHPHLIVGNNEAGKSTIYQFLLFMLFGLPPKQRQFFVPKIGGVMGGRLVLLTKSHGKVTIERTHDHENGKAICQLESGVERDEDWLKGLLEGMERNVYESTYGFNADELNKVRTLSGKDLGEVLLNIGLTGSDQIYQTQKWLQKQMEERFKPKGKNPSINEQIQVVDELQVKKKSLKDEEENYMNFQERQKQQEERMIELEDSWMKKTNQIYSTEQLLKVRPVLVDLHQTRVELKSRPSITFPESGIERYQKIKESILPLQSELNMLKANLEELNISLDDAKERYDYDKAEEARNHLENKRPKYEQAVYECERLKQQMKTLTAQMEEDLTHIDVPLEASDLEDYPLPFYIEEIWRGLKNDKEEIDREESYLREQEVDISREFEKVAEQKQWLEEKMLSKDQESAFKEKLKDTEQTSAGADRKGSQTNPNVKRKRSLGLIGALTALALGGLLQSMVQAIEIFFTFLLIAAGFGLVSYRSHKTMEDDQSTYPYPPSFGEEVEEARRELQKNESLRNEHDHLHEQWKQLNQEEIRLHEKRNHLSQRQKRMESAKGEQLSYYPFLSSLKIQHWEKLYHLLTQVKEKQINLKRMQQDIESQSDIINATEKNVEAFYKSMNWEFYEENMGEHWKYLQKWAQKQEQIKETLTQAEHSYSSTDRRVKENQLKLQTYLDQRDELFEEANIKTEEAFYEKANEFESQWKLRNLEKDLERQLRSMLSEKEQFDYNVWKEVPDETDLLAKLELLKNEREKVEEERKATQQRIADTNSALRQLEHSDERSSISHRLKKEQDHLKEQAEEWAVYQLAWNALEKTKHTYKEKYLPEVLKKAAMYFYKLTNGNYLDVKLTADDQIRVNHSKGFSFLPMELSRGTRDQLYVSFRLALGETMADTLSMPFLVDDAFVNFDKQRLHTMVEILEDLSKKHQVILFSWRDELADEFHSPSVLQLSLNHD